MIFPVGNPFDDHWVCLKFNVTQLFGKFNCSQQTFCLGYIQHVNPNHSGWLNSTVRRLTIGLNPEISLMCERRRHPVALILPIDDTFKWYQMIWTWKNDKECIDEENTMLNYTRYTQFIYSEISEITIPGILPWHISGLVHLYWDTYWAAMVYWECLKTFEPPGVPTKVGIYGFPIWAGSTTMRPSNNGSSAQLFAWDRKRASASLPTFHQTRPGQKWLGKCPILGLKLTPFCWPKLIADKKKLFAHLPHVFHILYCITKSLVSLFIPAKWIPIGIYKIVSSLYDHFMSNISPYYHYISLYLSLYNIHQYILNTYIYIYNI